MANIETFKEYIRTRGFEAALDYRRRRAGVSRKAQDERRFLQAHEREALSWSFDQDLTSQIKPEERIVEIDLDSKVVALRIQPGFHAWQSI